MRKHIVKCCVAALLAVAACGGGADDDDTANPSTTNSETTSPPTTSLDDGVKDAYLAAVATVERLATTTVDPTDPELEARFVDPALGQVRTSLSTLQAEGRVYVTGDLTEHRLDQPVTYQGSDTAVVTDCSISNDALITAGTTDVTFPAPVTRLGTATMTRRDGVWLVAQFDPGQRWDGVAGCAA